MGWSAHTRKKTGDLEQADAREIHMFGRYLSEAVGRYITL